MRFKKLEKIIIHSCMTEHGFIVKKILKRGDVEYKEFDMNELFVSSKTGHWKFID
ncbi:MAG: hypothetical protein E6538_15875 [Paeniclostridium sordellii]|nr:hypothetical protein [Paeniclostridium sordellii]